MNFSSKIKLFTYSLMLLVGVQTFYAQSYQFSKYSVEQGLPQQYVYSINQDEQGYIWVGTGNGISKFDGIEFTNYSVNDGLAENFVSCSCQSNNKIWLGHNKGGISRIINGKITTIVNDTLIGSKITDIIVDQDNYVWATSQNGYLIKISPKLEIDKYDLHHNEKTINCVAGRIEDNILIGTDDGLIIWKFNNLLEPKTPTEVIGLKHKNIQCITKSKYLKGDYWVGTSESGLYQIRFTSGSQHKLRSANNAFGIGNSFIKNIEEDRDRNLLVSTFNGLFKLIYNEETKGYEKTIQFNSANGLEDFVQTTFVDREGNTWIGLYGNGLAMLKDEIFVFYSHAENGVPNDTRSFLFQDSIKWFGLSSGLLKIAPYEEVKWKYYNSSNGFKDVAVTDIKALGDELFIATDGEGLYRFNTQNEKFKKEHLINSYLSNSIHKLVGYVNYLWVATEGGLIQKNLETGDVILHNTLTGLKHNSIYDIKLLKDGSIVLGSHSNYLTLIKDDIITHLLIADEAQLMDVVAIDIDSDNNLWLATLGNGVFKQEVDSFVQISSKEGLLSDYCYSVIADSKNGIWVGHRSGLSRISRESLSIEVFDAKKGINDNFNKSAVYMDDEKDIWFGTNKRTIKFNHKKFTVNTIPPIVNIKNIYLSDELINTDQVIEVPYKPYKLKIDYIGISFKQPDKVKYQYYLKGHDLEWSESTTLTSITYPRIEDGEYTFYVKACNTDGFCSEETIGFTLIIHPPFWKRWWFIIGCIFVLLFIIYSYIKYREKAQKDIQLKLESELAKRTKEVVKKSEEIEAKNKSITDSINYALRIQKSILPSKRLMKQYFPESFVFYKPRDIVSGDFYWYEKIGHKFIVACADCTGHGVPGAFMSMISSTLFKEISHQYKITEPSEFLYKLDELLKNTLKKYDKNNINDGLDLSICVFDLKTNNLSFSGAYRPVVIYKDKKFQRIKTTPYSIGGGDDEIKEFKTINMELNKGDIVYLFSDGYPDQFGGSRGKKLYLKGFENLLQNSVELEMDEQFNVLDKFLTDWKQGRAQVDDILVMGIKIK